MKLTTTIIQASICGDKPDGIPNQDYIEVFENDECLIAVVSDGLGSAKNSQQGAKVACKIVIDEVMNLQLTSDFLLLDTKIKKSWAETLKKADENTDEYRTTNSFIAVFKKDKKILVGQLGDVLVSIRIDGLFRYLAPTAKDFSNETECLGSDRNEKFKLTSFEFGHSFDFLIATDGIGDELQTEKIDELHNYFINKYQKMEASDRSITLINEIKQFFNVKNNDDKSLVFIWTNKN